MAPPIALTLLPTCAAAAGCGTSLLVPIPRAPTAKPNASSRPPCANGLRQVLPSLPATRRRASRLAPLLQPSSPSSRHRRSHSYLSPSQGQPVATRHLTPNPFPRFGISIADRAASII